MKKIILGVLIGLILGIGVNSFAAETWKIELQKAKIAVNGKYWTSKDKPALSINGFTYLSIKDIGDALNIPVYWNGKVVIGSDVPVTAKKVIMPAKDVWKAGNLQITFLTNSYDPKRVDDAYKYAAFNIELKNISNTDLDVKLFNLYIDPKLGRDFTTDRGVLLSGLTMSPGETLKGTLAFTSQDLSGPYNIKYSADGKVYTFTYTNRAY